MALCLGVGLGFGVGCWGFEIGVFWFLPLRIVLSTGQVWFLSVAARFPYLNRSAGKTNVNRLLYNLVRGAFVSATCKSYTDQNSRKY